MPILTKSRPDLSAHKEAATRPFAEIVGRLQELLGRKLTAYIAGVRDARALDRWIEGSEPYNGVEPRLRLTYQIATMLAAADQPQVVQAWFTGLNPQLEDASPATTLREGNTETDGKNVLSAARAFMAGG
jgi:hypothetical protein